MQGKMKKQSAGRAIWLIPVSRQQETCNGLRQVPMEDTAWLSATIPANTRHGLSPGTFTWAPGHYGDPLSFSVGDRKRTMEEHGPSAMLV